MAVYVDNFAAQFGRMKMCHMIADTHEELVAMADRIGVDRKWIQDAGTHREHFDICKAKRALAVAAGAQEVKRMELGHIMHQKRKEMREQTTTEGGR